MKKLLIALSFLCLLISCAKKTQPMPSVPSCQIVSRNDSTGKPIEIPKYDSFGNIIEINNSDPTIPSKYFRYYASNKIAQYTFDKYVVQYKYDNNARLDTILSFEDNVLFHKTIFVYDMNSNIATKTAYHAHNGLLTFQDSCIYDNYQMGYPGSMRKIKTPENLFSEANERYSFIFDLQTKNLLRIYCQKQGIESVNIKYNTFDLNLNASPIRTYTYLSTAHEPNDYQELFMAGMSINNNMLVETQEFNQEFSKSEEAASQIKITEINNIHGSFPKSWKQETTFPNIRSSLVKHFNFSYSCE